MQNYLFFGGLRLRGLDRLTLLRSVFVEVISDGKVSLEDISDGKVSLEDSALKLSQLKLGRLGAAWWDAYLLAGSLSSILIFIL